MSHAETKNHWEKVWSNKRPTETSWYQEIPSVSLAMVERSGLDHEAALIDVGCGASLLVDHLLGAGYRDLTVLDVSRAALAQARQRLAEKAALVDWIESDVRVFQPPRRYALWHDRAVFHFLTKKTWRAQYVKSLERSVKAGGQAIIASFAPGGPRQCSGLDVVQYDAASLQAVLGPAWRLLEEQAELHRTPAGGEQKFGFFHFEHRITQA